MSSLDSPVGSRGLSSPYSSVSASPVGSKVEKMGKGDRNGQDEAKRKKGSGKVKEQRGDLSFNVSFPRSLKLSFDLGEEEEEGEEMAANEEIEVCHDMLCCAFFLHAPSYSSAKLSCFKRSGKGKRWHEE